MSNPTLGAGQQFIGPYNILPDLVYTNPTTNSSQFTPLPPTSNRPSSTPSNTNNILANLLIYNPTFTNSTTTQFNAPYNILPDINFINPTNKYESQFNTYWNDGLVISSTGQALTTPVLLDNPTRSTTNQFVKTATPQQPINVTGDFTNLNNSSFLRNSFGYASSITAGALGVPQIGQSAQTIFNTAANFNNVVDTTYFTLPFDQLNKNLNFNTDPISVVNSIGNLAPITDFRSKRFASSFANQNANIAVKIASAIGNARKDGGSAALRGSGARALQYAAATLTPAGAYALFNLNGTGQFGYGWGDHDNRYALRSDFTLRSQISTKWISDGSGSGKFSKSNRPLDLATPFRGDKVTAIDFGRRLVKNAYQWLPSKDGNDNVPSTSLTKDFIKFFLTGPSITAYNLAGFNAGNDGDADDIIVFRAILTQLSDSFSPEWTGVKMIGRADQNYQYNGYGRTVSIGFDIVITDRDEIKPTWRKLNALAGYCAPKYDPTSIALVGPWMRLTLGDLFHQTPVVMTSLGYTYELDHSWEINIEGDKEMFETPRKISVTCDFNVITDSLPQNNGRFFGLAKRYNQENIALQGDDNWLSDFKTNTPDPGFNQTETRGSDIVQNGTGTIQDNVT